MLAVNAWMCYSCNYYYSHIRSDVTKFYILWSSTRRHVVYRSMFGMWNLIKSNEWIDKGPERCTIYCRDADHPANYSTGLRTRQNCLVGGVNKPYRLHPSPPLDNIRVMVIVWRLRGNITRTALCWIVWHNVHSPQHTNVSSSYRSNR